MTPRLRKLLFETLYRNKYLYRFASTVPFAGQWRVWQRQVLPRLQGHDVLEVGCGLGDLLADMLAAGYACQAVEHSPQMARAARQTLQKRQIGSPELVIEGSAQNLPFPANSFDNVVSTFPSEYIYDPRTIGEIARVLRPGGRLIVIEAANLLPVGFFQSILVLLQSLVYGPASLARTGRQKDRASGLRVITSRGLEDAPFGRYIPLEQHQLHRISEQVIHPRWELYITLGEK